MFNQGWIDGKKEQKGRERKSERENRMKENKTLRQDKRIPWQDHKTAELPSFLWDALSVNAFPSLTPTSHNKRTAQCFIQSMVINTTVTLPSASARITTFVGQQIQNLIIHFAERDPVVF